MTVPDLLAQDRFASLLGVRLVEHSPDVVVLEVDVGPDHMDTSGTVSAGVLFSLADCAMSLISNATGTAVAVATHLVSSVPPAAPSHLRAEVRRRLPAGSPASTWDATVSADGEVAAVFTGTTLTRP